MKILAIDGDPRTARVLGAAAAAEGAEVAVVADPREALSALAGGAGADLLILRHPDGGIDTLHLLRKARRAAPATPIALLLRYTEFSLLGDAAPLGFAGTLLKPLQADETRIFLDRCFAAIRVRDELDALAGTPGLDDGTRSPAAAARKALDAVLGIPEAVPAATRRTTRRTTKRTGTRRG